MLLSSGYLVIPVLVFFSHRLNYFQMTGKKLCQFCHNIQKHRLENAVTASLNTVMRQMTGMSQQEKKNRLSATTYTHR